MEIQPQEVHIWRRSLDVPPEELDHLRSLLSPDEVARAQRRIDPRSGDRVVTSRGHLRHILGALTATDPHALEFEYGPHGKPSLKGFASSLEFNVSHSGPWVLYAVARDLPLGIDIERIRDRLDFERLAQRFFSPSEVVDLMRVPIEQRRVAFFNGWTRKEAFIKVKGVGLALPLNQFDVTLAPGDDPSLLATRPDASDRDRFHLQALPAPDGYLAALATEGTCARVVHR